MIPKPKEDITPTSSSTSLSKVTDELQETCIYMWDQRKPLNIRVVSEDYVPTNSHTYEEISTSESLSETKFQLVYPLANYTIKKTIISPTSTKLGAILGKNR